MRYEYQSSQAPFGKITPTTMPRIIDCTYMPIIQESPPPSTSIPSILRFSKRLVFITTNNAPIWLKKLTGSPILTLKTKEFKEYSSIRQLKVNQNYSIYLRPEFDIGLKRTLALMDAQRKGYRSILLLDDDIHLTQHQLECGGSVIDDDVISIAGFHVQGFADISTLQHIEHRIQRSRPSITMTGSALFIDPSRVNPLFAQIYNDDLFFFLKQSDPNSIVSIGTSWQRPRNPLIKETRIPHEEYGDIIYESLRKKWGQTSGTAEISWSEELSNRVERISDLIANTSNPTYLSALKVARNALTSFKPSDLQTTLDQLGLQSWSLK